jgi:hypothetical protein
MQVMAGSLGARLPGLWEGFANRSLDDVLELVRKCIQLPAFDLERDGMAGDTANGTYNLSLSCVESSTRSRRG